MRYVLAEKLQMDTSTANCTFLFDNVNQLDINVVVQSIGECADIYRKEGSDAIENVRMNVYSKCYKPFSIYLCKPRFKKVVGEFVERL